MQRSNSFIDFYFNQQTNINDILVHKLMSGKITIEEVDALINKGADLTYCDYLPLILLICNATKQSTLDLTKYNIDICQIPLCDALIKNIFSIEIGLFQKIFYDASLITDEIILNSIQQPNKLDHLLSIGLDINKIIYIVTITNTPSYWINIDIYQYLIDKAIQLHMYLSQNGISILSNFIEQHSYYGISCAKIKLLIEIGIDIHINDDGFFVKSCCKNDFEVLTYLLDDCGCNINAHNSNALQNAIRYSKFDTITFLLERGININEKILRSASRYSKIMQLFIDHGINLEQLTCNIMAKLDKNDWIMQLKILVQNNIDLNYAIANYEPK